MKKVLVTGAAGSIGIHVIRYLLSEGKYEITALDLKNKRVIKRLKKFQKRINIIYGDINDQVLIENLVKDHDYIIHLASVMPPLGDYTNVGAIVDYDGTENIIKTINYYNKNCHLLYASSTSLYDKDIASVKDKINEKSLTKYSLNKYKTENLIKKKLSNYTILRLPLILNYLRGEPFMYKVKKNKIVEVTTSYDAAYAFVAALVHTKKINKKTFNVGMGSAGALLYDDVLKIILKNYGLSLKYVLSRIFLEKNYNSPILSDSEVLENIIHYQNDSIYNYSKRLKSRGKKRYIGKVLGKVLLYFKKYV